MNLQSLKKEIKKISQNYKGDDELFKIGDFLVNFDEKNGTDYYDSFLEILDENNIIDYDTALDLGKEDTEKKLKIDDDEYTNSVHFLDSLIQLPSETNWVWVDLTYACHPLLSKSNNYGFLQEKTINHDSYVDDFLDSLNMK